MITVAQTFVLDFVNKAEEIKAAFQPYYEQTIIGEQADPDQLYELQSKIFDFKVFYPEARAQKDEIEKCYSVTPVKTSYSFNDVRDTRRGSTYIWGLLHDVRILLKTSNS